MSNDLNKLLADYHHAEQSLSVEEVTRCSKKLQLIFEQIAPIKDKLSEENKQLIIELQNIHVRVLDTLSRERDQIQEQLDNSNQYKDRAKAYVKTQLGREHL